MGRARRQKSAAGSDVSPDRVWVLFPALLLAVCLAYQPAWRGGLVWDDEGHITRADLTSTSGLRRIWTEPGATQQYYPLLHSAFWVEHRLWGEAPAGYHAVNLVFHSVSAFLLVLVLRRLRVPGAAIAGVVFALHPLQVESVAWISEQKNTLSAMLALASALAYLSFDEARRPRLYAVALLLFLLALLSKTTAAVLPAALLIVIWWKRGTIDVRRDVIPLLPFTAAAVAGGLTTAWVERTFVGAAGVEFEIQAIERLLIAGRALWFYLAKFLWPVPLIFNYPRWTIDATQVWQYIYPIAAVAAIGILGWRARSRGPLAAALLFGIALSPALGFIDVFPFRYSFVADHFAYLAVIPLAAAGAAFISGLASRAFTGQTARTVITIGCALLLGSLTWAQSGDYRDAESLYRATIRKNPSSWFAQNNLGRLLLGEGRLDEALDPLQEAARLQPNRAEPNLNLGRLHIRRGAHALAEAPLETAVRLDPGSAPAHFNRGLALQGLGRADAALREFAEAARLEPGSAEPEFTLANLLQVMGRPEDAIPHYRAALKASPADAAIYNNLGGALASAGHLDEAEAAYAEALRLQPGDAQAQNNLLRLRAFRRGK